MRNHLTLPPGRPALFAGAHDALFACLAQRAGFDGVWVSGLGITASHGAPDDGRLHLSEYVERIKEIRAATDCPLLVDAEAGFPSTGPLLDVVAALLGAGATAIALEDKVWPRANSHLHCAHELLAPDRFAQQIRAAHQVPGAFIVARCEALNAGESVRDTVLRCARYQEAGADALIIHSTGESAEPLLSALEQFIADIPVGVIPTSFPDTSAEALYSAGASFVIYANQGLRASIAAVRSVYARLLASRAGRAVEGDLVAMSDLISLFDEAPTRTPSTGKDSR